MIAYIVKISMDYARLKAEKNELERDLKDFKADYQEQKTKISEKFKDLYHSRNQSDNALTELTTTVKLLVQTMDKQFLTFDKQFETFGQKLDEINIKLAKKGGK